MKDVTKLVDLILVWTALAVGPTVAIGWVVVHFVRKWW